MTTTFASLYESIRAVLGDTDLEALMYSDAVLKSHVNLFVMLANNTTFQTSGPGSFAKDLTLNEQAKVIFRVAKSIIAPRDNEFAYKGPVMSVRRKGGMTQMMSYLDEVLLELDGGLIPIKSEGELDAIINGACRWLDELNDAIARDAAS